MLQNKQDSSILVDSQHINLNEYTFAQESMDKRFGLIFFMRAKNTIQSLFVKERPIPASNTELNYIVSRSKITNDHLIQIYGVKQVPVPNAALQIYFEEFDTDLQQEMRQHYHEKTRFSEAELYNILYSVVDALCCLERNSMSHNFIVPHNILKFENEHYKIHDNYTITQSHLYEHALKGHSLRYLAPEYFESLTQRKEIPPSCDGQKADIFSLGMCILEAGLLNFESDYINRKLMILDETALKKSLERFSTIYSKSLSLVLQDMLSPDPSKRPKPSTLYNRLPGKPLVKSHTEGGKKRKYIDRMINNAFPEKNSLTTRTDTQTTTVLEYRDKIYVEPKYSTSVLSPLQRESFEDYNHKQPNKLTQNTIHNYSNIQYHPPLPYQNPIKATERYSNILPNTLHVSDSVKNDPILSKFVTRLASNNNSAFEKHSASLQTEPDKSNIQINYSIYEPVNTSQERQQRPQAVSKTIQDFKLLQANQDFHHQSIEKEAKSFYLADELGETKKRTYPENPIIRSLKDLQDIQSHAPILEYNKQSSSLIQKSYDYHPLNVDHLEPSKGFREFQDKHQPESPIMTHPSQLTPKKSPNLEGSPIRSSPDLYQPQHSQGFEDSRAKTKIDDLISKALERSSINLYLSQRVSKELTPALNSPELDSFGQKLDQIPNHEATAKINNGQKQGKESYLNIIDRYQQENPQQKYA